MLFVAILGLLLLALFQITVLPPVPLLNIYLDLILLVILAWAMVRGLQEGAIGAFVGGIVLDFMSSRPLGSHALALLLTVLSVGWLGKPVFSGNPVYPVLSAFVATFLYNLILLTLSRVTGEPVAWGMTLFRIVLPQAFVQAALIPLVYWAIDRLDQRLRRRMRIG